MEQRSLCYSLVACKSVILAAYKNKNFIGNFDDVAQKCLQNIPSSDDNLSYNCNGYTFHFLIDGGFAYCVVAVESTEVQIPIAFLERIQDAFTKKYTGGKAEHLAANSLNGEFRDTLRKQMEYCVNHREEIRNLPKAKEVTSENIEKIMGNDDKIELLVKLHYPLWHEIMTVKQKLIVVGITLSMIPIALLALCPGFDCGC